MGYSDTMTMMNYIDLADLGVTYGDGSDATDALREAIRLIRKTTKAWGQHQRYCGVCISGPIRTRNIPELSDGGGYGHDGTPDAINGLTILLCSTWQLDETLEASHIRLIGQPWYAAAQFTQCGGAVLVASPNMPNGATTLKLLGHSGCALEHVEIAYRKGVGIESWGANRVFRHVSVSLPAANPATAGYPGLVVGNGYWLTLEHVNVARYAKETFPSVPGYPDGAVAVIGSDPDKPFSDYTGMLLWRDSVCQGGSVVIGSMDPTHQFGCRGVTLSNITTEYGHPGSGEDVVVTRGYVEDLTLDHCYPADSHGGVALVRNSGDLYGCKILGRTFQGVVGNPIHGLVWDICSAAPFHGLHLPGSGVINGTFFGPHEDAGMAQIKSVIPQGWELPVNLPPLTHRGADLTESAFELQANSEVQIGFPGIHLAPGDAIVCKVFAQVGEAENLDGGESILGFQNATIRDGNGGTSNYVVNSFRAWPLPSGGDVRRGGHWREVIVAGIVEEVNEHIQYVVWNLRGRSHPTRFWTPRWWRIPATEWNGLAHLMQMARYGLK